MLEYAYERYSCGAWSKEDLLALMDRGLISAGMYRLITCEFPPKKEEENTNE